MALAERERNKEELRWLEDELQLTRRYFALVVKEAEGAAERLSQAALQAPGGDADGDRSWETLVSDILVGVHAPLRGWRAAAFLRGLRVLVCEKGM